MWEAPGKSISVHLSLEVVQRLDREVVQAFRAITSRGSEVGGILLGRVDPSSQSVVLIEDYEPVACDYRRGPLYLVAEEDRQRWSEALARWKNDPEKPLSAVGYYRSNTRRDLVLDDDDEALIQEFFPAPENVFLLVKPFASKANQAGFFLWQNGVLERQSASLFPFRPAELAKTAAAAPATPAPKPAPVSAPVAPEPVVKEEVKAPPPIERPPEAVPAPPTPPVPPRPEVRPVTPAPPALKLEKPASPKVERPAVEPRPAVVKPEPPAPVPIPVRPEKPAEARPAARQEKPAAEPRPVVVPKPVEARPAASAAVKIERQPIPIRPARQSAAVPALVPVETPPPPEVSVPAFEVAPPSAIARIAGRAGRLARNRLVWIIAAILLLVAASSAILIRRGASGLSSAVDDPAGLALRVDRNGPQLVLSWNRRAALMQTAQRAILSIGDGDHREDVELDMAQLHNGSIVYSPLSSDVSFRLEVTDLKNGKSLAESVRTVSGKPSPSVPADNTAPPAQTAAAPSATTPAQPEPSNPAGPGGTAAEQPGGPPAADSAETPPEPAARLAQPTRTLTLPAASGGESLASRLSAPEPMAPSGQTPQVSLPIGSTRPVAPPPAEPKPAPVEAAKQAPPAKAESLRVGGAVQEAKLIRRRDPVYPPLARQNRLQGVVRVAAVIGPDGKVVKVDAISGPPLLRQAAIDAVKQWVYQPSLLNGQPVQAETQIDVSFTLGR